jgi:hypothetical protein
MKNKITVILITLIAAMSVQKTMAWSTWGHHITAYIAEKHLTPQAKEKCEHYLQHSLPHFSSWQDYWRNSHPFKEITHWHMNYVNTKFRTVGKGGNITRDAVTQIERVYKELANGNYHNLSDSMVIVNLKLLIHMVGDMHCPCHVGYDKESGFKGTSLYIKGKKYDRHKFWDAAPEVMHPKWKLDNYLKACDTYSEKEIKKIQKGNATKWGLQNAKKMVATFSYWERKAELTKLSKEQRKKIDDTMIEQLTYGGYRLAGLLNNIFSK